MPWIVCIPTRHWLWHTRHTDSQHGSISSIGSRGGGKVTNKWQTSDKQVSAGAAHSKETHTSDQTFENWACQPKSLCNALQWKQLFIIHSFAQACNLYLLTSLKTEMSVIMLTLCSPHLSRSTTTLSPLCAHSSPCPTPLYLLVVPLVTSHITHRWLALQPCCPLTLISVWWWCHLDCNFQAILN